MQTSKAFKLRHGSCCSMMVKGSFKRFPQPWQPSSSARPTSQPLFVALCTPTVDRLQSSDSPSCDSFHSVHGLDMTFTQLSDRYVHRAPLDRCSIDVVVLVTDRQFCVFPVQRLLFFGVFD